METTTTIQTIVQTSHAEMVMSVAISPNGKYLASVSNGDSAVKVWDLERGTLIRNFVGHSQWVVAVAFSPNGEYLLTGAWENSKLWDLKTGKCRATFGGQVNAVCFVSDDKIITGDNGSSAYLWEFQNDKISFLHSFDGHTDKILSVSVNKNGKYLATGSKDGSAKLWEIDKGTSGLLKTFTHPTKEFLNLEEPKDWFVSAVTIDPSKNPKFLITAWSINRHSFSGYDQSAKNLKVWNLPNLNKESAPDEYSRPVEYPGHMGDIYALAVSPDGKYLASGSQDKTIRLWEVGELGTLNFLQQFEPSKKLAENVEIKGHQNSVASVCFNHDRKYLVSGGYDKAVILWDVEMREKVRSFSGHSAIVYASVMTPDGRYVIEGSEGNEINIWDLSKGKLVDSLNKEGMKKNPWASILALDVSSNGAQLVSGGSDGIVRLWDIEERQLIKSIHAPASITSVHFSEDGKYLAAGTTDGHFVHWEIGKKIPKWQKAGYAEYGCTVNINAEKGYLVVSLDHYSNVGKSQKDRIPDLILIDYKNKNKKYNFPFDHNNRIRAIRMSKDGRYVASVCHDGLVRLWDLEDLENIKCIRKYQESFPWVISVDISDDGKYILTGNRNNIASLYDRDSDHNSSVHTFSGHTSEVVSISFSPDEKYVITGSKDSTTKIWDRRTGKEIIMLISIGAEDWAVVHPSGVFDASPGALTRMHYVMGMEIIELDQLKTQYWQPGLVPILMKFEAGELMVVDGLEGDDMYPDIKLLELNGFLLKVELEIRKGGLGKTSLYINGKELEKDINKERKTSFEYDLSPFKHYFSDGKNIIAIRSWNKENFLPSPYEVIEKGSGEGSNPTLYALFVGTSRYEQVQELSFPDQDATYLSQAIKLTGDLQFDNRVHLTLLTSASQSDEAFSNKDNIKQAFDDIAKKANPQDIVIIYFSGHGDNIHNGERALYYYLTHKADSKKLSDPNHRTNNTVSSEELSEWLKNIRAMKQVLILDTCYAGKVLDSLTSKDSGIDAAREREFERMKDIAGIYVLAGSAPDQVSYEGSIFGQGFLTYALLMGMKGTAWEKHTNDTEYKVELPSFFTKAQREVERISKEFGVDQIPTFRPPTNNTIRSYPIGFVNAAIQPKIKLAVPKPLFVRSNFLCAEDFLDDLDLSEMLDRYLAGNIGIGNRPKAICINVTNFPGAHYVRGLYTKKGTGYEVKVMLYKDEENEGMERFEKKLIGKFTIKGQGMEDIVPKIAREVEIITFPIDDYEVPDDDEIGALEKGLRQDLETIKGKPGYGYDPDFIGKQFSVPLPKFKGNQKTAKIVKKNNEGKKVETKEDELKYQYYSVKQCKSRKFPHFAACNLHGGQFLKAGRSGAFIRDPRLAKTDQWGDDLYTYEFTTGKKYSNFCHRGHMTKREDTQWGEDKNTAVRGAKLTFFFTNSVPQHGHLNGVVWRGLEDYIMEVATDGKKGSKSSDVYKINILTGPVFQDDDPFFPIKDGKVKVPVLFWKVIYYRKKTDNKLYHIGFMMGQKKLLEEEFGKYNIVSKEAKKADKEAELFLGYKEKETYQVKVSFIEKKTKLKFHPAIDPYSGKGGQKVSEVIKKPKKKGLMGNESELTYGLDGLVL